MLPNTEPNLDVNFKTAAITNGSGSNIRPTHVIELN